MNQEYKNENTTQEIEFPSTNQKSKRHNDFTKKLGILVLSGAILGTSASGSFAAASYLFPRNHVAQTLKQDKKASTFHTTLTSFSNTAKSTSDDSSSVQAIAEKGMPSIVAITNKGVTETMTMWGNVQQPSESCGSGIIIGETEEELLVVTNNHVIEGNQTLTVVFSFDENSQNPDAVEAHVKGYDSKKDLAVIAISKDKLNDEILSKISIAAVGNSADLTLGEQVVAIGNALGYGQSVTTGIVSALNRQIGSSESSDSNENTYIQTDAAINPGNSGGALFNMKGELIGINTAKIASEQIEGMGYAIPITDVHDLIEDLMNQTTRTTVVEEKDRGYLGISGTDVSSDVSSTYNIPEGIYVSEVENDSAASKAGLKKGYVITKFDGKSIRSTSDLKNLMQYYKAGETVTITAQIPEDSDHKEKEFQITLGKNKNVSSNSNSSSESYDRQQQAPAENSNPFDGTFGLS